MASTSASPSLSQTNSVLVDKFCSVTGSCREKALKMLEVCNWNLEMAINMHVDSDLVGESTETAIPSIVEDNIRAPIPQSRAVLVEEDLAYQHVLRGRKRRSHSVFDGFRDFQAETRMQELSSENLEVSKKRRTLEDLFRPPLDMIHRGNFESARDFGQSTNKWLMVNLQNSFEFSCQVLNRDVWSNPEVKSIINKHFVFWQVYSDSVDGERYMQFYKPVEFPYVAVIDPRTGEKLVEWHQIESATFCDLVNLFLKEYSYLNGLSSDNSSVSLPQNNSLIDKSEEEQLRAALAASLKESVRVSEDNDSELETFDSDSEHTNDKISIINTESDHSDAPVDVVGCDETGLGEEDWESLLGSQSDPYSDLILRLPDGDKKQISWPCSTKIKALLLYANELGFDPAKYELVTNFPRRIISSLDLSKTLKDVDLFPREIIIIQQKT